ncbi:MAG TPA: nucleotidyltransferase family protein [Sphingomonas sp.]|jgi:hypothetical protein
MSDAALLVRALRDPSSLPLETDWLSLLTIARAEQLIGTLAHRLAGLPLPEIVAATLHDARASAEAGRRAALWEAEMARRVLAPIGCRIVLLKGTAFVAAGLMAGQGRSIGDLDILVPRDALGAVEAALLAAGWEWVKPDPYDDAYYREHMHELPPLIHRERDRMIDVHHAILPLTARITPNSPALIGNAQALANGLFTLAPADMIVHAAAHLLADGDLAGGLRNLWDIHCLIEEFGSEGLEDRARLHGLDAQVRQVARQAHRLFGTAIPTEWSRWTIADRLIRRRLLARDGWGRPTRPATRLGFYVRSHWLRMPPVMLARHLWVKARRGAPASGSARHNDR